MSDPAAALLDLFDLSGKRIVVTGAAVGLGFKMAEILSQCGAKVTLADIDEARLTASAEKLGGDARPFVCDVRDETQVQALFDDVVAAQGGVDVTFANAGLAAVPGFSAENGQNLANIDRKDWDHVLSVNLTGAMHTMRSAAAVMRKQDGGGRIVVTASTAAFRPEPLVCYGYVAAKGALVQMVRHAALDNAPYGVLVNAIAPGPFYGTMIGGGVTENPTEEMREAWQGLIPLGRMAHPDELRGIVVLLASDASSFMTGATYLVDGGSLVQV
ncbi:MAG TPA: SDR family oxidoreductase [Gaiellaceae bacterium]|nr:SDR family oxidoreductase [Gaiellaceae bacterium]